MSRKNKPAVAVLDDSVAGVQTETELVGNLRTDADGEPKGLGTARLRCTPFTIPYIRVKGEGPNVWRTTPRQKYSVPFTPKRNPFSKPVRSDLHPTLVFMEMIGPALDLMIEETNRYGSQHGGVDWRWNLDKPELCRFLACLFGMFTVDKPNYRYQFNHRIGVA